MKHVKKSTVAIALLIALVAGYIITEPPLLPWGIRGYAQTLSDDRAFIEQSAGFPERAALARGGADEAAANQRVGHARATAQREAARAAAALKEVSGASREVCAKQFALAEARERVRLAEQSRATAERNKSESRAATEAFMQAQRNAEVAFADAVSARQHAAELQAAAEAHQARAQVAADAWKAEANYAGRLFVAAEQARQPVAAAAVDPAQLADVPTRP